MYTLEEAYRIIGPNHNHEMWNGKMACAETDAERTLLTNSLDQAANLFSFTIIEQGNLVLDTGAEPIHFSQNEMYVYFPGVPVRIRKVSADYRGICLIVDEQMTYDTSGFRNLIRASLLPLSQYSKSKITLSADDAHRIGNLFRLIIDYIRRAFPLKDETLDMLYSVFINDIINIQEFEKVRLPISRRTEELFVSFYSLVRQNFTEQRSIRFYADRLHVTPTYLSRVVKQVMGQTVMDCIDSMLSMESRWLLTTTNLTVSQIASHLNFSSTAAFDKFYKRMTGTTPLAVRK